MRTLPIADLDRPFDVNALRIATPCDKDWDEMRGDERKRHCDACALDVYNISDMTRREVRQLIDAADGQRVCGRLWKRPDGTVITQDCPVGIAERAWLVARNGTLSAAASALTLIAFLVGAFFWVRAEIAAPDCVLETNNPEWQVEVAKPAPVEEILKKRQQLRELRDMPKPGGMMAPPPKMILGDMVEVK